MRPRRFMLVVPALAVLAGCGGPPPPVPPTLVTVNVSAAPDANNGAPVSVRVYQLASAAGFEGAQFFPLFNGDAAVLKDDLVKRDDLLLAPGQSRTLALAPPDRVKALGVFAAFREYEGVTWRAVVAVPPHVTSTLAVTLDKAGVSAVLQPQAAAK